MVGGFAQLQNRQGADWGQNLLNSVATKTLRHLFSQCEAIDVSVECSPSNKLLQGSIDSFKMSGRGLVIRKVFRTEAMSFETDAVSIDFSSALKGKIALKQPTQAIAQVKLTEHDINQAFQAQLVRKRLENLTDPNLTALSGGQPVSFTNVQVELLPHNRIQLWAHAEVSQGEPVPVCLSCTLSVERRRRIRFKDIQFEADGVPQAQQASAQQLVPVLGEILNDMVDLDRFDLDGVTMRLNRLETEGKTMLFSGYAQIERVPQSG
jgi:hypothetical protein